MARMLGRLGWHGQCACCCGPDTKREVKRQEEREWRRDQDEPDDAPDFWGQDDVAWRPSASMVMSWLRDREVDL